MKTFPMRSLTSVLAVTSFLFLTAAKGDGCGPTIITEPPTPIDPPVCAMGSHIETICDGGPVVIESTTSSSSGGFGSVTASSSGGFGTGGASSGTTVGAGGFATTGGGVGGFSTGGGPDEPPPPPGSCHEECVPDDACGPGTHAEVVCAVDDIDYGSSSSSGSPAGSSSGGSGGAQEPYPGDCQVTCVPDAFCPPGTHAEPVCGGDEGGDVSTTSSSSSSGSSSSGGSGGYGGGDEPPTPADCPMSCVPDTCPPGTEPVEVCDDSCEGMATCWIECQEPIDPNGT